MCYFLRVQEQNGGLYSAGSCCEIRQFNKDQKRGGGEEGDL